MLRFYLKFYVLCNIIISIAAISNFPILIVVSYDAFKYDYFKKNVTPHMTRLQKEGTSTDYLITTFPTKTYPNHFTIATGLYAESHGITGNALYDSALRKKITYGYDMFHYNEAILPIWIQNEIANKNRHSGVMMWPGCDFKYQGKTPTYLQTWDKNINFKKRIDTIMDWLTNPKAPANLVFLYIEQPDSLAHVLGTNHDAVIDMLKNLDDIANYLDQQLTINGLKDRAHVVHVSDHGMINASPRDIIHVSKQLVPGTYEFLETSPGLHVIPAEGQYDDVLDRLKTYSEKNEHFTVYTKRDMPERWHFKNCNRTPPIFILADMGYVFDDLENLIQSYIREHNITVTNLSEFGVHGYDNNQLAMYGIFFARGPLIKKNNSIPPFENLNLVSLFSRILNIPELPNNGSLEKIGDILVDISHKPTAKSYEIDPSEEFKMHLPTHFTVDSNSLDQSPFPVLAVAAFLLLFLVCVSLTMMWLMRCKKKNEDIPLAQRRYAKEPDIQLSTHAVESQQLLISDSDENDNS